MPCLDPGRPRESVVNESESVRLLEGVGLDIPASVGETMRRAGALDGRPGAGLVRPGGREGGGAGGVAMRRAGALDGRLGADCVSRAAREAVAAWAMAVDGDDAALAAIAGQD